MKKAEREILKIAAQGIELEPKQKGSVGNKDYKYNTLADVQKLLKPILKKTKLFLHQIVTSTVDTIIVTTAVHYDIDSDGFNPDDSFYTTYEVKHTDIYGLTPSQADASMSTNIRKNVLKSLFGIISEEEDDNDGQGEQIKAKKKKVLVKGSEGEKEVIKKLNSGEINEQDVMNIYNVDKARLAAMQLGF